MDELEVHRDNEGDEVVLTMTVDMADRLASALHGYNALRWRAGRPVDDGWAILAYMLQDPAT